jgi:hypothetical protein
MCQKETGRKKRSIDVPKRDWEEEKKKKDTQRERERKKRRPLMISNV